jgi:hypothetical protein
MNTGQASKHQSAKRQGLEGGGGLLVYRSK